MFQYNPFALLMLATTLVSAALAFLIWRRRPGPGIFPYTIMLSAVVIWAGANAVKLSLTSFQGQFIAIIFAYIGITIVPAAWLLFTLEYTGREKWINRTFIAMLAIEPIIVVISVMTSSIQDLFFTSFSFVTEPFALLNTVYGLGFWVHAGYSYIVILIGTIILIASIIRSPELYRGQILWLVFGAAMPWVANAVTIFELHPIAELVDLTPIAFTLTGAATAWAMYRFRLMDIVPVAKDVVIRTMPDALFVIDNQERVVEANPEILKLLGFSASDVLGKSAAEVFRGQPDLLTLSAVKGETTREISFKHGEEEAFFATRISPIVDRHGNANGRVVLMHDISDLKKANREMARAREIAEAANQLKSQFLANMSHELRTPLNAIIGYTQLQLAGMVGDISDEVLEYQERILVNAQDLLKLINDVLDVSKIEAGRMELVERVFSPTELAGEVFTQFKVLADERNLNFRLDLDESMPAEIIGDDTRLKQIMVNLVSNAIKFTDEGEVVLKITPEGADNWQVVVSDTGIGIPPHMREVIFDEFRQVDAGSTREHGGTGLGLAIVRRLVLMMGGTIQVKSEMAKGSDFIVTLPIKTEQPVNDIIRI